MSVFAVVARRPQGLARAHCALKILLLAMTVTLPVSPVMAVETVAAEPVQIAAVVQSTPMAGQQLERALTLLEDSEGKLTIEQVSAADQAGRFQPTGQRQGNLGFSTSVWWARVKLSNFEDSERELVLRQDYPLIDHLDVYVPLAGAFPDSWRHFATGDRVPFDQRPIAHHELLFPLTIPAHSEQSIYLRYQSQGPVNISLSLYSMPELLSTLDARQIAFGIYYGCVLMLLVWSLLVYLAVRDRTYLAYFAYVAIFGLYMAVNNGLAFQFLWPDSPHWANTSLPLLLSLTIFASLQFARMILQSRALTPGLDRIAQSFQVLAVVAIAATPVVSYGVLIIPVTVLILASVVLMLVMAGISALEGSRPAGYFLLAWGAFLTGSIVYLSKVFGLLPHNFLTHHGWQIGSLLEMILLSLTLSSRVRELQQQSRADALTQLGNRRLFDEQLPRLIEQAGKRQQPLALCVLDIDHFKRFNDTWGHSAGDAAIQKVGEILRRTARKPFLACRYGGEEFVLLLPNTGRDAALRLAERLRSTVQAEARSDRPLTISIGIALLADVETNLEDSDSEKNRSDSLFSAADFALYSAKAAGRNCVVDSASCRNRREEHEVEVRSSPAHNQLTPI